MRTGTVKFFNNKNKFGFIIDDVTKKEYYIHAKGIDGIVNADDRVQFELKSAKKGWECTQVKRIE